MGRNKKNLIHGYFEYNTNDKTSKCLKCSKVIRGNHSSNLLRHFSSQHRNDYNMIVKLNDENKTHFQSLDENTIRGKVTKCCLDLVTVHGRPFSMLEDDAFQELLKMIPGATGLSISAKCIKSMVADKAYEIRMSIFNEIKNRLISLKVDVGSIKSRRFLGINIQFVQENKIVLRNLGVIELHECNTGQHLKDTVLSVLCEYGIEIKQIYSTTTDNGANMLSMSRQLSEVLDEDFEKENETADVLSPIDEVDYQIITNDLEFNVTPEENDDSSIMRPKISAVRCAAHTLQLAVNDALKDKEDLLQTVRQAARALRTPSNAAQLRSLNLLQAIIDCTTRWDSTADMLERIILLKNFCKLSSDHRINLSDSVWDRIQDTISALTPCRVLSKKTQNEQLTFGDFYILWTQCILQIEKLGTPFALLIKTCMKNREQNMFQNESFLSAVYLDLEEEQLTKARNHLKETFQRLLNINSAPNQSPSETQRNSTNGELQCNPGTSQETEDLPTEIRAVSSIEDNENLAAKDIDFLLADLYRLRHAGGERRQININSLLFDFLKEPLLKSDSNILEFWNSKKISDPHLHSLAMVVLSTPPTQVSVERLFSSLKFVMSNLRTCLKDKNINDILVIRNNYLYSK